MLLLVAGCRARDALRLRDLGCEVLDADRDPIVRIGLAERRFRLPIITLVDRILDKERLVVERRASVVTNPDSGNPLALLLDRGGGMSGTLARTLLLVVSLFAVTAYPYTLQQLRAGTAPSPATAADLPVIA